MAENLERVVAEVVAAGPDRVLICGDLALASGEQADYAMLRELVSPLASRGIPMHVIPGNHDNRDQLVESLGPAAASAARPDEAVSGKIVSSEVIGGMHWAFLDSLEEVNGLPGRLGRQQLDWLARRIEATPLPAVVCLHHNPQRSLTGLHDADEFLDVVLPRRRVKAVLFGHTHEFRLWQNDGLHFVNLPACGYCLLVKPNRPLGWVLATIRPDGMHLDFRGLTPREPAHGSSYDLPWRGERVA